MRASHGRLMLGLPPRCTLGLLAIALAVVALVAGCGDNGSPSGPGKDTTPPTVLSTVPTAGATDVSPYPIVEVHFSEAMDPTSIDTLTFYIDGVRAGLVTCDSTRHKARLFPFTVVSPSTEYTVHIETGVKDSSGNAMAQAVVFHFTTGDLDCAHLRDRFEPDDDIASATSIETDASYPGLTSCGGAERYDYFRFTLAETKQVKVTMYVASVTPGDAGSFSWGLDFLREDGESYSPTGWGVHVPGGTLIQHHTLLPGTYWLKLGNQHTDGRLMLYRLKLEALDPAPDDQYEDNDFPDEATPIEPGLLENLKGAYVDVDYYSLNLTTGQTITATATELTTTGTHYRLAIADTVGNFYTVQDSSDAHANPGVQTWTATVTGKHLIYVNWWADDVDYTLNVGVTP
ncbi:MAG TPA: Ig-like domain-containing protein [bacterium]|nr:Ig-like domain-containing protein [bacterium]